MRNLIKLTDYTSNDVYDIFKIADEVQIGKYNDILKGRTVVLFLPDSSIRTRVSFEKGIYLLGGQPILFSSETLDKKESLKDVCGYLNNWADVVIARHKNIDVLDRLTKYLNVPVINAMTDINHPCEVLADMYSLSKIRKDFTKDKYLFCGMKGNIGLAWKEASEVMGLDLVQCCEEGYEIEGLNANYNMIDSIQGKDIICTDSFPDKIRSDFLDYQISKATMEMANEGAILNPCPPFYRGEEVTDDVIETKYFVGYEFKKHLLEIHQAIIIYCLTR